MDDTWGYSWKVPLKWMVSMVNYIVEGYLHFRKRPKSSKRRRSPAAPMIAVSAGSSVEASINGGSPIDGWFIVKNPTGMDDWGVPPL